MLSCPVATREVLGNIEPGTALLRRTDHELFEGRVSRLSCTAPPACLLVCLLFCNKLNRSLLLLLVGTHADHDWLHIILLWPMPRHLKLLAIVSNTPPVLSSIHPHYCLGTSTAVSISIGQSSVSFQVTGRPRAGRCQDAKMPCKLSLLCPAFCFSQLVGISWQLMPSYCEESPRFCPACRSQSRVQSS